MSALGQNQTCAAHKAMSALPRIATAKADFRKRSCLLYPQKRTCAVQDRMSAKGQKRTLRSNRNALRDARPVHCVELVVASRHKLSFDSRRFIGMSRIKGRCGVVFYTELNPFGRRLTCDFRNKTKSEINTRGHPTTSNHIAIFHHSCLFIRGSDEWQKIGIGPMSCGPTSLQKTGHTQNKCARAH